MILNLKHKINKILSKVKNLFFKKYTIGQNSLITKEGKIENLSNDPAKIRIGNNCVIRGKLLVFAHGGEIVIGDNVFIGERTELWSANKIKIGNNVMVSHGSNILDTDSHPKDPILRAKQFLEIITNGHPKEGEIVENIKALPIVIEDYAWISFNCTIIKGVTIGKKSIVGANTVVTKSVQENSICINEQKNIEKKI